LVRGQEKEGSESFAIVFPGAVGGGQNLSLELGGRWESGVNKAATITPTSGRHGGRLWRGTQKCYRLPCSGLGRASIERESVDQTPGGKKKSGKESRVWKRKKLLTHRFNDGKEYSTTLAAVPSRETGK